MKDLFKYLTGMNLEDFMSYIETRSIRSGISALDGKGVYNLIISVIDDSKSSLYSDLDNTYCYIIRFGKVSSYYYSFCVSKGINCEFCTHHDRFCCEYTEHGSAVFREIIRFAYFGKDKSVVGISISNTKDMRLIIADHERFYDDFLKITTNICLDI